MDDAHTIAELEAAHKTIADLETTWADRETSWGEAQTKWDGTPATPDDPEQQEV